MAEDENTERVESQLASTLRSLADGVVAADLGGRVIFLNRAAEQMTGWPAALAGGRPLAEVFRIAHPSGEAAEFIRLGAGQGGRPLVLTNKDGQDLAIEDRTAPIRDGDGSLAGLVILFRLRDDTSGRAGGGLADMPDEILEGLAEPIFCLDAQWRFTYVNAPAAAAFGAERPSLIGRVLWNKFPPSVHRRHYQDFCSALLKRERRTFDLHDEATGRWWEASINPFNDGLIVLLQDVTDKKAAVENAARLDRLESLGLLARGFAHDFNNLLTVIVGNLSLAQSRQGEDPPSRRELENARQATQQAQGLVQNLLTFARGGAPVRRRLAVAALVAEVAATHHPAEGTALRVALGPDLGEAEWDPAQVRRLLSNLVRNAEQAIPRGRAGDIFLRVFVKRTAKEAVATFEVIDNGRGIAAENLARVFEPYFTTRGDEHASGLGLTVCESIAKAHGGRIEVRSQPGQTVFAVSLPALTPVAPVAGPGHRPRAPASRTSRILVLEDEPLIRQLVFANLSSRGFVVETTTDGSSTVQRYREELEKGSPFDLVILDLSIPSGQGGRETMEQLRVLHPEVRAIVSSGYSDDAVMSRYMDFGFRAVLPKPYDPAELVALVSEVLMD
jgi:two-component system cell cycle sensor histidine kinase/response regulator CckA